MTHQTNQSPKIDKRTAEDIQSEMKADAAVLLPQWKPAQGDPGEALAKIFSHMMEDLLERLNRVPRKHFTAFLDMLGIAQLHATPAKAPVTFFLSEGAEQHVPVPKGTPMSGGEEDVAFETEKSILATPAQLVIVKRDEQRGILYMKKKATGNLYSKKRGKHERSGTNNG